MVDDFGNQIDDILNNELTPEQIEAAKSTNEEVLCLACAGSGKSRTLAYRITRLLMEGEPAESIVAFTFTDNAGESIKRRVSEALIKSGMDPNLLGAMYIGTVHSYCQHILGKIDPVYRQYEVLDTNKLLLYLISRYPELSLKKLRTRENSKYFSLISDVASAWNILNDEMLTIKDVEKEDPLLGEIFLRLKECLKRDQYIDFSQMVRLTVDAFRRGDEDAYSAVSNLQHLMVDEYQDISPSQEELIRQLHEISKTLFVVGDDDQSIYGWRGADVSNILSFGERYEKSSSHTLSENFRSTDRIVEVSNKFISEELGPSRFEKSAKAHYNFNPQDFKVLWFENRRDEAQWIAERIKALLGTAYEETDGTVRGLTPADFAIIMRSTRMPESDESHRHFAYTRALEECEIPYSLEAGGGPFGRPQVDVLRKTFELLRKGSPSRTTVRNHYENEVLPAYPYADFDEIVGLLTRWGVKIHTPPGGTRQRIYPQKILFEMLESFGLSKSDFPDEIMREIGLFSRMIQDVEAVYMSVDSSQRYTDILNFLSNPAETGYDVSTDDVIQKPDMVNVSTVHKVKGLEFPVVFVVDIEAQRFPGRRSGYGGLMPSEVMEDVLSRGAYQKNDQEEARLFYTAITRAERYLYVTGSKLLPGGKKERKPSRFANRLIDGEDCSNHDVLPAGLTKCEPKQRIDESILPTSFSEIRYYLRCPMDYRFRKGFGFTPPIPELFGFGKTVHTIIEKIHASYPESSPSIKDVELITDSTFHLKHVPRSGDPENNPGPYERAKESSLRMAKAYVEDYEDDFSRLRDIEARFEVPADGCVISGAIDLLLKEDPDGRILDAEVIDYKAMDIERNPEDNDIDWMDLSLQVQLYAKAARSILDENAGVGYVHFLKDSNRVEIPISDVAIDSAISNIEWAVKGIIAGDFPMRPHKDKCKNCDFVAICPQKPEEFVSTEVPPQIHSPEGEELVRSFSLFEKDE